MKLYYVGLRAGKEYWLKHGIARGGDYEVWHFISLCTRSYVDAAVSQLCLAYDRRDMVVMYLDVPKRWLRKWSVGRWECCRDIPPERVKGELFLEV